MAATQPSRFFCHIIVQTLYTPLHQNRPEYVSAYLHNYYSKVSLFHHFRRDFLRLLLLSSVTRLGDLLDFGQLLKLLICPNIPHSQAILVKVSKSIISSEIIWGNFNRHLAIFSGHTAQIVDRANTNSQSYKVIFSTNLGSNLFPKQENSRTWKCT